MQDLKTGHLLGAAPKAQFWGQVIGATVGAILSAFIYRIYTKYGLVPWVAHTSIEILTQFTASIQFLVIFSRYRLPTSGSSLLDLSRVRGCHTEPRNGPLELQFYSHSPLSLEHLLLARDGDLLFQAALPWLLVSQRYGIPD